LQEFGHLAHYKPISEGVGRDGRDKTEANYSCQHVRTCNKETQTRDCLMLKQYVKTTKSATRQQNRAKTQATCGTFAATNTRKYSTFFREVIELKIK
jgi:hypothetical protein